ncbi:MAG: hypothetical protein AAGJ40_20315 [Planctomycetota bacterium]
MKPVIRTLTALLLSIFLTAAASAENPGAEKSAAEMATVSDMNRDVDSKWIDELEEAWAIALLSGDAKEAEFLAEFIVVMELFVYDDITRLVEDPESRLAGAGLGSGR